MASSVFFKFKSQKEPQRVTFDGTGISVFELKREIINLSRLGDGTDFDLLIYNEDGSEEYDDDTTLIPRSTSVIARRLPAARPGQGRAARYVSGRMPVAAKNAGRLEQASGPAKSANSFATTSVPEPQTEEEKIQAMFKAQSDDWERQKQQMATAQPGSWKPNFNKNSKIQTPDHPPPLGYICYRCGEKGHWIQACPTNNDPTFDGRPRVKRTTGIPRSMLQTVEKPSLTNQDEDGKQPAGVMVNADGDFVVAVPDTAAWEQYQAKAQASAKEASAAAAGSKELQERGLECPIDKRMFVDPHKTPCCGNTYCHDCIENALINGDLVCPACGTESVLLDALTPDAETAAKIKAFEEERKAQTKARSLSPAVEVKALGNGEATEAANLQTDDGTRSKKSSTAALDENARPASKNEAPDIKGQGSTEAVEPAISTNLKVELPPKSRTSSPDVAKKRKAEEEMSNDRKLKAPSATPEPTSAAMKKSSSNSSHGSRRPAPSSPKPPTAPRAMQQQQAQQQMQQQQQQQMAAQGMMASNGMPNMNGFNPMAMGMNPMMGMNPAMMQQMMMMGGFMQPGMFPQGFNGMGGFQQGPQGQQIHQGQQGQQGQPGLQGRSSQQGGRFNQQNGQQDDDAYMRKPVNPSRGYRNKKARPVDYREL